MRNIKVLRVSERKNFSHVYDDAYTVENGKRIFVWQKHWGDGMGKNIQKYLISKQASTQHEQRIFPLLYAPIMHEHKRNAWKIEKLGKFCIKTNSLLIN